MMIMVRLWLILSLSRAAPLNPKVDEETTEEDLVTDDIPKVNIVNGVGVVSDGIHSHTSQNTIRDAKHIFNGGDITFTDTILSAGNHAHINIGSSVVASQDPHPQDPDVDQFEPQVWGSWNSWSSCTRTCGEGNTMRSRTCTPGGNCQGDLTESRKCNPNSCPTGSPSTTTKTTASSTASTATTGSPKDRAGVSDNREKVDRCSEPFAVTGNCRAHFPSWSYNQETGKCKDFIDGGCGNTNRFESKQECAETCETTVCPADVAVTKDCMCADISCATGSTCVGGSTCTAACESDEKISGSACMCAGARCDVGGICTGGSTCTPAGSPEDRAGVSDNREKDVTCGNHKAASCSKCPQGANGVNHGKAWCNGDCSWNGKECILPVSDSCSETASDLDCCSSTSPCKENEGDCDTDDDCVGSLVCGKDNCRSINPLAYDLADCCIQPVPIDGAQFSPRRPETDVTCGNHKATSCAKCPDGGNGVDHGKAWCNGDCIWKEASEECEKKITCACGIKEILRVHGGVDAEKNEFPWMALLKGPNGAFCGGSLINDRWIVTAAHCFLDYDPANSPNKVVNVILGEHDTTRKDDTTWTKQFDVDKIIRHPKYFGNKSNDIALWKLSSKVNINKFVPVCLPAPNEDYTGKHATITGWGVTEDGHTAHKLQKLEGLPVWSDAGCEAAMQPYKITPDMLCAGGEEAEDGCQGDSGGPLHFKNTSHKNELIGVVSWGEGCGNRGKPGVYAETSAFVDWIKKTVQDNGGGEYCPH